MQIPCGGRTLDLNKNMNNQMVKSAFQVKCKFLHFAKKQTKKQPDMFLKGTKSHKNSHLLIGLSGFGNYEM